MNREVPSVWDEGARDEFMADCAELSSLLFSSMHEEGDSAPINAGKEACQRAQEALDEIKQAADELFSDLQSGRKSNQKEGMDLEGDQSQGYIEFNLSRIGSVLDKALKLCLRLAELSECAEELQHTLQELGDESAFDMSSMNRSRALMWDFLEKWCDWMEKLLDDAMRMQARIKEETNRRLARYYEGD